MQIAREVRTTEFEGTQELTQLVSLSPNAGRQLSALAGQAAVTSKELNEKFVADSSTELSFGERMLFDDGLEGWIGVPNATEPMEDVTRAQRILLCKRGILRGELRRRNRPYQGMGRGGGRVDAAVQESCDQNGLQYAA